MSTNTVMLGNSRGTDGIFAFSREVLFSTAGELVYKELPAELAGRVFYIKNEDAKPISGTISVNCQIEERYKTLAQTTEVFDCESVLVIAAPMPEITSASYKKILRVHEAVGEDITVLCCDGTVQEEFAIIRDVHDEFVNIGHCDEGERALHAAIFKAGVLKKALENGDDSLFNIINFAAKNGASLGTAKITPVTQIVTGLDAYTVQKKIMERVNFGHLKNGVVILDPINTYIAPDAVIGAGARILPGTIIKNNCKIGKDAVIGPNTLLEACTIGDGTTVNSSQVYESVIGDNTTVGPYAYVRPNCTIGDGCRIGDFVELKKSKIGNGTKVSHLTYIGDATVGERVNFGCGTVVVNYDGYNKYQTIIGDDAFIGCNTNLVSPVKVGDRAFTAAGATITRDIPDGALGVARVRQENKEGWNDKRRAAHEKK